MKVLAAIWNFLDGKKTALGATCYLLSQFVGGIENSWMYHTPFLDGSVTFLQNAAEYLGGAGLVFKFSKAVDNVNAKAAAPAPTK